jgi:hypothetical protein
MTLSFGAILGIGAFVLGILCNGLVCLAVWCSFGARSLTDRVIADLEKAGQLRTVFQVTGVGLTLVGRNGGGDP